MWATGVLGGWFYRKDAVNRMSIPATAKASEDSIFDFYRAYEGKEPAFDHQH